MRTDILRTLATTFGSNSVLAAKAIRELQLMDPDGFRSAVGEVLRDGADLPGAPYLMAVLVAEPDWLRTACNPDKYTLEQSLDMLRRARKLNPVTEVTLARMLTSPAMATEEESRFAARVMEILERSPNQATALPALRELSHCKNARVRSKAALLIGRIVRNPQWAEQGAWEGDPRVAANAVESLWGVTSSAARDAFLRAARDERHRIAANGMVGLYLMGDECSIPFLFALSHSVGPFARAAAAWAMGHVEDPRFLPRLVRLMEDAEAVTRKGAFKSMARIRQRVTRLRAAGVLQVQLSDVESSGNVHRIHFVVTQEEQLVKGLDTRQFVVWSGPDVVEEFSSSLQDGDAPSYEIVYEGPPLPAQLVKVQVYAEGGVGEDARLGTAVE